MIVTGRLEPRSYRRGVAVLVAVAVLLRLALVLACGTAPPESDGDHFHRIALSLLEGRGFGETPGHRTAHRAPLHPLWLALWYMLLGPSAWAGSIAAALLGGVLVFVVADLASQFGGARAGILAAAIAVGFGHFLDYSVRLWSLSEGLFIVLLSASLACWCRAERGSSSGALGAGILLGLATLTRPITLLMPGLFLARAWNGRLPRVALAGLGFLLILAPWTARNWYTFGRFIPVSTMGGIVLYQGFHPPAAGWGATPWEEMREITAGAADEVEASDALVRRTLDDIRADPGAVARLLPRKLAGFWSPFSEFDGELDVAFIGLLLLGALGVLLQAKNGVCALPLLTMAYLSCMALVFYGSPRFRVGIEPALAAFAGVGLGSLLERRRWVILTALVAVLGGLGALHLDSRSVRLKFANPRAEPSPNGTPERRD